MSHFITVNAATVWEILKIVLPLKHPFESSDSKKPSILGFPLLRKNRVIVTISHHYHRKTHVVVGSPRVVPKNATIMKVQQPSRKRVNQREKPRVEPEG